MATIDPTRRAVVSWNDWESPDPARGRLTVAWLDERDREMAWDLRGLHAYWIAQCFKARDVTIDRLRRENEQLQRQAADDRERVRRALKVALGG